jgi:hypothetical protein
VNPAETLVDADKLDRGRSVAGVDCHKEPPIASRAKNLLGPSAPPPASRG